MHSSYVYRYQLKESYCMLFSTISSSEFLTPVKIRFKIRPHNSRFVVWGNGMGWSFGWDRKTEAQCRMHCSSVYHFQSKESYCMLFFLPFCHLNFLSPWGSGVEQVLLAQGLLYEETEWGDSSDETGKPRPSCRSRCGVLKISPAHRPYALNSGPDFAALQIWWRPLISEKFSRET
jgi:hypothetical protein